MKKQLFLALATAGLLVAGSIQAEQASNGNCWQTWAAQSTSGVTDSQISEFKAKLPSAHRQSFDSASKETQALSVVIQKGLMAANPNMNDTYSMAYKIANKAEIGYYMNMVKKRLNY